MIRSICSPYHRGFTIAEMLFTLSITTVAMVIGTKLLISMLYNETVITIAEHDAGAIDQAVHLLRIDLENTTTAQIDGSAAQLTAARWKVDHNSLTRISGAKRERFDFSVAPQITRSATGIMLQIGEATWALPAPQLIKEQP